MLLVGNICTGNLHLKRVFAPILTYQRKDLHLKMHIP